MGADTSGCADRDGSDDSSRMKMCADKPGCAMSAMSAMSADQHEYDARDGSVTETEYDNGDRAEGMVRHKAGYADSDKCGNNADKHSDRAGYASYVPDEYDLRKAEFVGRGPKRKMKRLGEKIVSGNVKKLAAAFDRTVGGGSNIEVFKKDSALQEKISLFEKFQGKCKDYSGNNNFVLGGLESTTNIYCVGNSQDQQQARDNSDGLSGPMGGGERLDRLARPHPRGMWEGGGAEKRGTH